METIADRIRHLLKVRGYSQRELAKRSELADTQVSTILAALDKDPGAIQVSTLQKLARGGGCTYEWLATGAESALVEEALRSPRFCDLPDWPALLADAKVIEPTMPDWVWRRVAVGRPVADTIKAGEVAGLARHLLQHAARPSERDKTGPPAARSSAKS